MRSQLKKLLVLSLSLATFAAVNSSARAQQIFRIVGADGKVTFSDQAPSSQSNATVQAVTAENSAGQDSNTAINMLPYALKQVAIKYPVTFYTSNQCSACAAARAMLVGRGIPFTEKTISTTEDIQALERLSGDNSLPFATLGGQQLKGYAEVEWTQFLNAAGYPAVSQLPASYRQIPATPLVKITSVSVAPKSAASSPARRITPVTPATNNPSGIRF
ncbi:Hybrid peroxiredoxin hyPrx5 [Polaromonas vacuolata]|uniref:Hybrid peroxiredoxin hyPrx5 n=1 Tax=Polaromonas vacuolata TaxID=37448 RepID=A0A6H2HAD4_9BURK|nr:glutaredoxin family protein [Polaromonas vacuolata]QJC56842.1 Hybrid peroxiredoxin hyPrx5 [Polaromonas vacuolata]